MDSGLLLQISNATNNHSADLLYYTPQLAHDFQYINGEVANAVVMDWAELVWCFYFGQVFGLVGSQLDNLGNFVYSMKFFGWYPIWLRIRGHPTFLDAIILNDVFRCLGASFLNTVTANILNTSGMLKSWTVVTFATNYGVSIFDHKLRQKAGCRDQLGDPTEWFPNGSWVNCDDWKFAYQMAWAYSMANYVVLLFAGGLGYFASKSKVLMRLGTQLAVAMTATNSMMTSIRSSIRVHDDFTGFEETLSNNLDIVFYVIVGVIFLAEEAIHKLKQRLAATAGWAQKLAGYFAAPLVHFNWLLVFLECKLTGKEMPKKGEEAKEGEDVEMRAPETPL